MIFLIFFVLYRGNYRVCRKGVVWWFGQMTCGSDEPAAASATN